MSSATTMFVSSTGSLVGATAAAGCASTPVALSVSKVSRIRRPNLLIILVLPSSVALAPGCTRAGPARIEGFSGRPSALSAPPLRDWWCPQPNGAQPRLTRHPTRISHRLPPAGPLAPGKIDLRQATVMKPGGLGEDSRSYCPAGSTWMRCGWGMLEPFDWPEPEGWWVDHELVAVEHELTATCGRPPSGPSEACIARHRSICFACMPYERKCLRGKDGRATIGERLFQHLPSRPGRSGQKQADASWRFGTVPKRPRAHRRRSSGYTRAASSPTRPTCAGHRRHDGVDGRGRLGVGVRPGRPPHVRGVGARGQGRRSVRRPAARLRRRDRPARHPVPRCRACVQVRHDWGSQYRSAHFTGSLAWPGIADSPAFPGEPECNGCAERWIKRLKEQCLWHGPTATSTTYVTRSPRSSRSTTPSA